MRYRIQTVILLVVLLLLSGCTSSHQLVLPGLGEYRPDTAKARGEVYKVLMNMKVSVDWDHVPLREVIEQLSASGDIEIVAAWSEDSFGEGLNPKRPVDFHLESPVRMVTALEEVLSQATEEETDWCLDEGFVRVGTREVLNDQKYLVVYPMTDLLKDSPFFSGLDDADREHLIVQIKKYRLNVQNESDVKQDGDGSHRESRREWSENDFADEVIDLITSMIDPYEWELNGGEGGSIRYFEGALFIRASDYLHRKIGGYRFGPSTALVR